MKIEAGCKAVIVKSVAGHNGTIVTVIKRIGHMEGLDGRYGDLWEIDTCLANGFGFKVNYAGERQLRRIDDDSRQITSWETLADIYKPPLKKVVNA